MMTWFSFILVEELVSGRGKQKEEWRYGLFFKGLLKFHITILQLLILLPSFD